MVVSSVGVDFVESVDVGVLVEEDANEEGDVKSASASSMEILIRKNDRGAIAMLCDEDLERAPSHICCDFRSVSTLYSSKEPQQG